MTRLNPSTFSLRRRTPGSFVLVPCPKLGRALRCQGQLERAAAVVLAASPALVEIQEQPAEIWYAWTGSERECQVRLLGGRPSKRPAKRKQISYIVPDFLVVSRQGQHRLIEIKPFKKLAGDVVRRKLTVAVRYASTRGWTFHVLTERELLGNPLVGTLKLLARYRVIQPNAALCDRLQRAVSSAGTTVGALIQRSASEPAIAKAHLWHLLADEALAFDPLAGPLNNDTIVFPKGSLLWDPFDSVWASSLYSTDGPTA